VRVVDQMAVGGVSKATRHSEVNQEYTTALESNNQILPATIDGVDALALELGRDDVWVERPCQPRILDVDALEAAADEGGLETGTDGLDLRKLGHGSSLAASFGGMSRPV